MSENLQLVTSDTKSLRSKSLKVDVFGAELKNLADELSRIRQQYNGRGISAPQVGKNVRLIIMVYKGREVVVVNPVISNRKGSQTSFEGCLSLPSAVYGVKRPQTLTVTGQDIDGNPVKYKCNDYDAPVAEHEVDHLDGILIDKRGKFVGMREETPKDKLAFAGESVRV